MLDTWVVDLGSNFMQLNNLLYNYMRRRVDVSVPGLFCSQFQYPTINLSSSALASLQIDGYWVRRGHGSLQINFIPFSFVPRCDPTILIPEMQPICTSKPGTWTHFIVSLRLHRIIVVTYCKAQAQVRKVGVTFGRSLRPSQKFWTKTAIWATLYGLTVLSVTLSSRSSQASPLRFLWSIVEN